MFKMLHDLAKLRDGWLEGGGVAPDKTKLSLVCERMVGHYPEHLPVPLIVPTPEGNLLLEWELPGEPSVDLGLAQMTGVFHAFREDGKDLEHEFHLDSDEGWRQLYAFLDENLEQRRA